jgi:pimeloyl-ACP methyl ester carboxylesterase
MRPNGAYLDVAGVHMYYEVSGDGDPVVLLHGGMATSETTLRQLCSPATTGCMYPSGSGHGRTPDVRAR